ncbi:MAG: sugar-binding transcriptional regulator [Anaerolineaceae bacterium]|nr:sugar-binding transcriptional regulator [Anaerolineaceae bacterium]
MEKETRRQLLADIATFYYKEKKTQSQIARAFGYSRSAISRLLDEAEQEGIIEITINYPLLRDPVLERRLKDKYHLEAAFVINAGQADYARTLQMVGRLGALYLEQNLRDGMVIGIGWGTSLYDLVNSLPYLPLSKVRVVQVIGASGSKSDARIDGPDLAAFLASKLNADHLFLHSPLLLDSHEACNSMKSQKQIRDTLNLANQSDFVLLGVGTIDVDPKYSSIFRSGFLNEEEVLQVKDKGGVGNICGVIIDEKGRVMDIDLNHRVMAVDLHTLRSNGRKMVGIAAGSRKSKAIEAVLIGGWLDVLITDQSAVKSIAA